MAVEIIRQIGIGYNSFKIAAVAVNVAGHHKRTRIRQGNNISLTIRVGIVGVDAVFEQINDGCCRFYHVCFPIHCG